MKSILIISLISLSISFNLRYSKQNYDSYVFACIWPKGISKTSTKNTLNIHGLWPSLKSGKMLDECTSGVEVIDDGSDIFLRMREDWPGRGQPNKEFWEHEYNKHGYCMVEELGLKDGYKGYFTKTFEIYDQLDLHNLMLNTFPEKKNVTLTLANLRTKIREFYPDAEFKILCGSKAKGYPLQEFYFYLNKDFTPSSDSKYDTKCTETLIKF